MVVWRCGVRYLGRVFQVNVKRFSRAADGYWRVRYQLHDVDNPVDKIKRPKYMETRVFARRIRNLRQYEAVMRREIMSIRLGRD